MPLLTTGRLADAGPIRIMDLSTGAGHLAVGLARLGACVTATECSEEHDAKAWRALTQWAPRLVRAGAGAEGQDETHQAVAPWQAGRSYPVGSRGGSVELRLLNWGAEDGLGADAADEFDVLILSELVALGDELQEALLETLKRLLGPRTVAYAIFAERPFSMGFLLLLGDEPSLEVDET